MSAAELGRLCLRLCPPRWQLPHRRRWAAGMTRPPLPSPGSPVACKWIAVTSEHNVSSGWTRTAGSGHRPAACRRSVRSFQSNLPAQTNKAVCCLIGRLLPIGEWRGGAELCCPDRLRSGETSTRKWKWWRSGVLEKKKRGEAVGVLYQCCWFSDGIRCCCAKQGFKVSLFLSPHTGEAWEQRGSDLTGRCRRSHGPFLNMFISSWRLFGCNQLA